MFCSITVVQTHIYKYGIMKKKIAKLEYYAQHLQHIYTQCSRSSFDSLFTAIMIMQHN